MYVSIDDLNVETFVWTAIKWLLNLEPLIGDKGRTSKNSCSSSTHKFRFIAIISFPRNDFLLFAVFSAVRTLVGLIVFNIKVYDDEHRSACAVRGRQAEMVVIEGLWVNFSDRSFASNKRLIKYRKA